MYTRGALLDQRKLAAQRALVGLEGDFCGAGASGRNAGHVTPTIGKDLPSLLRTAGRERAVDTWEETIRRHAIDCDYVRSGNIIAGVHPRHREPLRKSTDAAAELGVRARFVDEGEMRERGIPPAFRFGVLKSGGGHVQPGKYALGLRRALLASGAIDGRPIFFPQCSSGLGPRRCARLILSTP